MIKKKKTFDVATHSNIKEIFFNATKSLEKKNLA
jgi:hypothetical protein